MTNRQQLYTLCSGYYESPDETSEIESLLRLISDYVTTHNSLPRQMVTALSLYRDISIYPWVNYLVGNFDYSTIFNENQLPPRVTILDKLNEIEQQMDDIERELMMEDVGEDSSKKLRVKLDKLGVEREKLLRRKAQGKLT